ncbi:MAG: hypothetical protein KGL54_10770 [Sphingomonadales bacterium]|nr:hypothetical protein [Sphingomonadales bacterium]
MLILGQNGSGKSVIASRIGRSWAAGPVVVFDPKGDDREAVLPNMGVARRADDVVRHLPGRVLYRPSLPDYEPVRGSRMPGIWASWERVSRKILEDAKAGHRPTLVIVHELATLTTSQGIGPAFAQLIREGRSLGITLILITQRPQGTSLLARSEAQHVVCMTLADQAARDVAAELLADIEHPEWAAQVRSRPLPLDHSWWYRGPDFRLRLHAPVPIG